MPSVTNYNIEDNSGANVRTDLNNVFEAIQTNNSDSTKLADSKCKAGMWFYKSSTGGDTDDKTLQIRNSSNSDFVVVGKIDEPNLGLLSKSGGKMVGEGGNIAQLQLDDAGDKDAPALCFDGDTDLGLFRKSSDIMGFACDSTEQMLFDASGITLQAQNSLRFSEATANGSNYVGFKAPATVSSSLTWILPAADATVDGYALVSDTNGNLRWDVAGAGAQGGGNDNIFWENDQTITQNYTISNNKNAGSFGPIEIQSGVTVTVGAGETWTVV